MAVQAEPRKSTLKAQGEKKRRFRVYVKGPGGRPVPLLKAPGTKGWKLNYGQLTCFQFCFNFASILP